MMNHLIARLLIHCLQLLMEIKEEVIGSRYSHTKERETIMETEARIRCES